MSTPAQLVLAAGHYVHWGVISVSVTNLLIMLAMVLVFLLALVLPFPHHRESGDEGDQPDVRHRR